MAVTQIERRYCRVEDWEGNIYLFSSSSGAASGSTVNGSDATNPDDTDDQHGINTGAITSTDGQQTSDTGANTGNSIIISADPNEDKNVITTKVDGIPFGKVAVDIRIKSTIGSGTTNILRVNCYFVDNNNTEDDYKGILISTTNITGDMIGVTGQYVNVGFVTDYKGNFSSSMGMKVEVLLLHGTGATINLDQISMNKSYTGVVGVATNFV